MRNRLIALLIFCGMLRAQSTGVEWGAYTDNTQESARDFAAKLGKTPPWQMIFVNVADGFPRGFAGNLAIFLEIPVDDDAILDGSQDADLKFFAQGAAKYSGQIILALNEEVNGNANMWSGTVRDNTPAKAIAAFQHEENIIKPIAPNIKFAYSVTRRSVPERAGNSLTSYYPGDNFVDVVGVNGTNLGLETWDQMFGGALETLSQYHKPLWILSEATVQSKAQFIADTFAGAKKYHLAGFLYFNQKGGDGDWLLDDSAMAAVRRLAE
jgi:mannan endo-1,4-beta-mannosidase